MSENVRGNSRNTPSGIVGIVFAAWTVSGLLFGGSSCLYAQEISLPVPLNREQKIVASTVIEPTMNELLNNYRPGVFGMAFMMNPMFKEGFGREFGVTEEQNATIMDMFAAKFRDAENDESLKNMGAAMENLMARIAETEDDFLELTEEEKAAISQGYATVFDKMQEVAREFFTEEQMAKVVEMEFATFGGIDTPFLHLDALETVLDLDEEQENRFEELQADIADEKLEVLDEITHFTQKFLKTGKLSVADMKTLEEKTKALQKKVGERTREILTDEQLEKATKIVVRQQHLMKGMMGGFAGFSKWMPGADSWMPGQPLPDDMKSAQPKRTGLFPRPKKKAVDAPPVSDASADAAGQAEPLQVE